MVAHNIDICHAQMCYDGEGWNDMITAVPKHDELSLEYLRMLVRGPFRSMSDLIKIDRIKDNYYLHLMSLDKWPANVLMNFCIASRTPIEFDFLLSNWAKRCEAGFEPTLAFLLTYSYGYDPYSKKQHTGRSFNMHRSGHMWLDPASKWSNILNGLFEGASKPFKTHPQSSRPTNIIWGHCADYTALQKMTDDEIAAFYTQPVQILEPPPKPIIYPKMKKPVYHAMPYVGNLLVQDAVNFLGNHNPAVEIAMPDMQFAPQPGGGWGQLMNDAPQPQPIEHYDNAENPNADEPDEPVDPAFDGELDDFWEEHN